MVDKLIELQKAAGIKEKCNILKKYSDDVNFCRLLYYALNPLLSYNLSESTLKDITPGIFDCDLVLFSDIFECCEFLSRLRGIDDATIRQVKHLIYKKYPSSDTDVIIKILSKSLRLGITSKTVNKIIPGLIPEWEVQQGYPIDKYPVTQGTELWVTEKLNGVRATFYNGRMIGRSGIPIDGLGHIEKELSSEIFSNLVVDGELTLLDKGSLSDNEAFRRATGIINSENVNKTSICFTIFDAVPIKDFESSNPNVKYSLRRNLLDSISERLEDEKIKYINVLPVLYYGRNIEMVDSLLQQMVDADKEGLMINLDVPYKRTRHRGILKVKRFYTMDLPIVRCEDGRGRLANTLGAIVLDYKGNEVKVGTGISDEMRKTLWERREDLTGSLCEVKYKEISRDKGTGLESLQFPVFVRIRNDKFDVSYG